VLAVTTEFCQAVRADSEPPLQILAAALGTVVDVQQLYGKNGLKVQTADVGVKSLKLALILAEIWAVQLPSLAPPVNGHTPLGANVVKTPPEFHVLGYT
jgi:hypothetical protein